MYLLVNFFSQYSEKELGSSGNNVCCSEFLVWPTTEERPGPESMTKVPGSIGGPMDIYAKIFNVDWLANSG